jgi:hypothetical protein
LLLHFLFYIPVPLLILWMRGTIFLATYLHPDCKLAPFTSTLKMVAIHSIKMISFTYNNYMVSQLWRPHNLLQDYNNLFVTSTCRAQTEAEKCRFTNIQT